ncbi:hypothetical protein B0T25DRAFT_272983 [Lasiosphaeria hispida]|uniref:Uncharacterized protein n=1 Tax=Lasiosphaeria hispida TaxID=260671 RepID=A0AAJ0HAW5_9PEZI|nr:hypothetical protein B0T25DRAFT_272983 [Lasiosphaeria hispida]
MAEDTILSKRYAIAACNAAPVFTPIIGDFIQNKVDRTGGFGVADAIIWGIPHSVLTSTDLDVPPRSIDNFLSSMDQILSGRTAEHIRCQAYAFDDLAGIKGIANEFIRQRPTREAMFDIIHSVASWAEEIARQTVPFDAEQAGRHPSASDQDHASDQHHSNHHEDEKGSLASVTPLTVDSTPVAAQPSPTTGPCPIVQLNLNGMTILEAWSGNLTTRAMEIAANSHERGANPSHFSFRALPVYHGTDAFQRVAYPGMAQEIRRGLLHGSVTSNQVAPPHPCLPILWTGFSPLRCFLWAAFRGEVLQPVTCATVGTKLGMPWRCEDHEHVGILLFKFRPSLPSAPGQASYVIPSGREQEWASLTQGVPEGGTVGVGAQWRLFSRIHGNAHSTWPEAIHCREFGQQLTMLSAYVKQFWRTVWFGDGITALQESHEVTYSISFTLARANVPQGDKYTVAAKHKPPT